jgi:hypothetical protein
MCIALLFVASLGGLVFGGVYALYFEGGILAFVIAYWAGGTMLFLAISLFILIRGGRTSDGTGESSNFVRHLALSAHGLDTDEHVLPRDSLGAHVISHEARHLECTGADVSARRLG